MKTIKNYITSICIITILPVVLLTACSGGGGSGEGTSGKIESDITAITYNIRIGAGTHEYTVNPYSNMSISDLLALPNIDEIVDANLPLLIEAIQSVEPNIIALQEVKGDVQAAELANTLNMNYTFTPHNGNPNSRFGLALLTSFDIVSTDVRTISLTAATGKERRIQIVTLDIDGKMLTVINLHIDHLLSDGSSESNIATAIGDFNAAIALGDYNATPDETVLNSIKAHMVDSTEALGQAPLLTSPGQNKQIDYIFLNNTTFSIVGGGLLASKYQWTASDHNAVIGRINFR